MMSLTDLPNLTYELDASSVGALQTDFMKQWSLNPLADNGTRGAEIAHSVSWSHPMSQREAIARFLCHLYVAHMPARGLQELYETLRDMVEFYNEPPAKEQALLSQPLAINAKVTAVVVRPDFAVDYDEE